MAWEPGQSGNPAGRQAGVPNKMTRAMREAFLQAFDELGGVPALVAWAARHDDNRGAFYGLISKLLPREVDLRADVAPVDLAAVLRERLDRARIAEHDAAKGGDGAA